MRKSSPGARHALSAAEKRNHAGWFHPQLRAGIEPRDPERQCRWCLRFQGPDVDLTGELWGGGLICDRCANPGCDA